MVIICLYIIEMKQMIVFFSERNTCIAFCFLCVKIEGWGESNCLSVAKIRLKIYLYSTILFVCMEQLYMEALLIHWQTSLKFSSEYRNLQIPEISQKNHRPIHPDIFF